MILALFENVTFEMTQVNRRGEMYLESLTELIKSEIKRQFGSVKEFSVNTGIPTPTLNTAFQKGIEGSSYELVRRICSILHIKKICDDEIFYVNEEFYNLVKEIEKLDEQAMETIKSLLKYESERCKEKPYGFNGIGHVEKTDEHIKNQIRKVLAG